MIRLLLHVIGVLLVAAPVSAAVMQQHLQSPVSEKSINESVAVFEYLRGNKAQAIEVLSLSRATNPASWVIGNRDLYWLEQLHQVLMKKTAGKLPSTINNNILLEIASLKRQNGDCKGAVTILDNLVNMSEENRHKALFQRVACLLSQQPPGKALEQADALMQNSEGRSLWLAYLYNNMAVVAQNNAAYLQAQTYFKQAMTYTDSTREGQSLMSYLTMGLAYSYFSDNRFGYAEAAFAQIPNNTPWLDVGLLGFGWAAYRNNQPGLALEAWRQLVRLPFKSINVYEGFIAIPFAFEKQNAPSEALLAYKKAMIKYQDVIGQIDALIDKLNKDGIHQYALAYERDKQQATSLHPLLVYAYSQPSFQAIFDSIDATDQYAKKLQGYQQNLEILRESNTKKIMTASLSNKALLNKEAAIENQLREIKKQLASIAGLILDEAFHRQGAKHPLYKFNQRYQQIIASVATDHHDLQGQLDKIKGVLIGRLHEERELFDVSNKGVIGVIRAYEKENAIYQDYLSIKKNLKPETTQDEKIQQMQRHIESAMQRVQSLRASAEERLSSQTIASLLKQKQQLKVFDNQARMAATRLSEDFYQKGGQRLWH